jgi:hypothetical protein
LNLLTVTAPAYNADGAYTPVIILFSFFIGMVCCMLSLFMLECIKLITCAANTLGSAIEAGVSTM